ncbi:hypothetical protein B296_00031928, partial [Ensete ventricosum]
MTSYLYSSILSCKRSRSVRVVITRIKYAHDLHSQLFQPRRRVRAGNSFAYGFKSFGHVCFMVLSATKLPLTNSDTCLRTGDSSG